MLNKTLNPSPGEQLQMLSLRTAPGYGRRITAGSVVPPFLMLLVLAALVDWLVTRTVTRFAIFIPKSPLLMTGYELTSWLGLIGSALAALLALITLAWVLREEWRLHTIPWLAILFAALGVMSIIFLFIPPGTWSLLYNAFMLVALLAIGGRVLLNPLPNLVRVAILVPTLAMFVAGIYQTVPTLYAGLQWPGPPAWSSSLYQLGEFLVIAGALSLWWAYGRQASRKIWVLGAMPALFFASVFLVESALTATIVVWSNGLTLFLSWWLYTGALWLVGVTVLTTLQAGRQTTTAAILLLCAAGYAPQLSSQFFFGLIALWLLAANPVSDNYREMKATNPNVIAQ